MTTTVTEPIKLNELLISEANGGRSRETVAIKASAQHELDLGDVVETSSGELIKQLAGGTTYGVCITPKKEGLERAYVYLDIATEPTDADTVVIGSKTYTFEDTLSDVDGNVHNSGTAATTLKSLCSAINLTIGSGTEWAASMTKNTQVEAVMISDTRMKVQAINPGSAGNSIASTETLTDTTDAFTAATLTGGQGSPNTKAVVLVRDCEVVQDKLDVGAGVAATVYTDLNALGVINKNRIQPATAETQTT